MKNADPIKINNFSRNFFDFLNIQRNTTMKIFTVFIFAPVMW